MNEDTETAEVEIGQIEELFAFVAAIEGEERILTGVTSHGIATFIVAGTTNLRTEMENAAQDVANETGKIIKIVKFERSGVEKEITRKLIEVPEIVPPDKNTTPKRDLT